MRKLFAFAVKDIRLLLSRKGWIVLLVLPVVLGAVLYIGLGDLAGKRTYVQPFAVAVRDRDATVFSRSLIRQIEEMDIFREVELIGEETPDEEAFSRRCAGVVTIPEGFFYGMYDMSNVPAELSLNPEMAGEAAILQTVMTSICGILTEEQAVWKAEYALRYPDGMNEAETAQFYYDSANYEFEKIMGRSAVFDYVRTAETYVNNRLQFVYASVIAILCMYVPLCVLKSVPEEARLGVVARLASTGTRMRLLSLSKLLASCFVFVLIAGGLTAVMRPEISWCAAIGALAGLLSSYLVFDLISFSTGNSTKAQMIGNLYIIVSLFFAGAVYPYEVFPPVMQTAAWFTVPFHVLGAISGDFGSAVILTCTAVILFLVKDRLDTIRRNADA